MAGAVCAEDTASEPVIGRLAALTRSTRTCMAEHKAQLALPVRVTIAALASLVLSRWLQVPMALWVVLTAVILTQLSFGSSLKATVDYLVGTLGGAVYAGSISALIPHASETALSGVLALAIAPLALLAAVNPRFRAAPFTGALVILEPGLSHVNSIEPALYRVIEVATGGFTALAVSLLVFPTRAHSLAIRGAAQMLDLAARSLPELFVGFDQALSAEAIGHVQDSIGQAFADLQATATEARHERIGFLTSEPDQGPLLRALRRLRHDLVMIGRAASEPLPERVRTEFVPLLGCVEAAVADCLRESADALVARREPSSLERAAKALDRYSQAFSAARAKGDTRDLSLGAAERMFTAAFALEHLRKDLIDLERCIRDSAQRKKRLPQAIATRAGTTPVGAACRSLRCQ